MVDLYNGINTEIIEENRNRLPFNVEIQIIQGAKIRLIDNLDEESPQNAQRTTINIQQCYLDIDHFLTNSSDHSHKEKFQLHEEEEDKQSQQKQQFLPVPPTKLIKKKKQGGGRHKTTQKFNRFREKLNLKRINKNEWFQTVKKGEQGKIIPYATENNQRKKCTSQPDNTQYQIIKKAHQLVEKNSQAFSPEFIEQFKFYFPSEENSYTFIKNSTYFEKNFVPDKNSELENQIIEKKTQLMLEALTNATLYSEFTKVQQKNLKDDEENNIINSEMREHLYKLRLFEIIQKLKESDRKDLFQNWLPKRYIAPDVFLQIDLSNIENNTAIDQDSEKQKIDYLIEHIFSFY